METWKEEMVATSTAKSRLVGSARVEVSPALTFAMKFAETQLIGTPFHVSITIS